MSPSAEAETVLRALQLRLDRPPQDGFTNEALAQRSELLRFSADLLTNQSLRQEYETALLAGASGLEFSSNREVAGLILLWEAEASIEAFKLACKALQPPQAPALGSGREADLTLVAALSCRAAALNEQEQRHYQAAAVLLTEGIQLLQRMGKLPQQRSLLEEELKGLLPYRILDLVSRDLGDQASRQDGLRLLDGFVRKRGGLEGKKISNAHSVLSQEEFELFFQQIRKFLTVQEQADLFLRWQRSGSADAAFLGVIALTAVGFSRRKPEKVYEARKQLKALDISGVDSLPLIGCMDLLLANVELAKDRFLNSPDKGLQDWLENYPEDNLAALCEYCRDWLRRDVLPGYRDVDAEAVNLEAWFADRDVQDFVERLDRKGARGFAKAGFSFLSSLSTEQSNSGSSLEPHDSDQNIPTPKEIFDDDLAQAAVTSQEEEVSRKSLIDRIFKGSRGLSWGDLKLSLSSFGLSRYALVTSSTAIALLILLGAAINFIGPKYKTRQVSEVDAVRNDSSELPKTSITGLDKQLSEESTTSMPDVELSLKLALEQDALFKKANKSNLEDNKFKIESLIVENPSKKEILNLLENWLLIKALILNGSNGEELLIVARPKLVERVKAEQRKDALLGQRQQIEAKITSIKLVSQTSKRIEAKAKLIYREQRFDSSGKVISETSIPDLTVTYVLGREKQLWQLVDYISGS